MKPYYDKKLFVCMFIAAVIFSSTQTFAQCSTTPVTEAVRNGDFEAGFLTKNGNGHNFTANGPFDFQSELVSGPNYNAGAPCNTSIGNMYGVSRRINGMTCTANAGQTHLGTDYINVPFTDHTPGQGGNGYAFIADFEAFGGTSSYGNPGLPAAWRQRVDIYPNQKYYFSAWFANYNRDAALGPTFYTTPTLNFIVIPINAAGNLVMTERMPVGTATPTGQMQWQQFYGEWTPQNNYTRVALFIEVQQAGAHNMNDLVIDDISFINGCSNINSLPGSLIPELGPDFSICLTNGSATLNSGVAIGGTTQFWWYSGTTTPQTALVTQSNSQNTYTINAPGTYRVCIQNSSFPGSCSASSTIVVTSTMPPVTLSNAIICDVATATLSASLSGTGLTYTWYKRPGAVANPGNVQSFATSVAGTYGVQVSSSVAGCPTVTSNDATVTINSASPTLVSSNCSTSPATFNLNATTTGGSGIAWWDAASGGNQIGGSASLGLSYTAAQLPRTVYVENYSSATAGVTTGTASSNTGGATTWSETNFSAAQNFTLVSVYVQTVATTCSGNFTLSLSKNGAATGYSVSVPCNSGTWQQVFLNWPIQAGATYRINATGAWFLVNTGFSSTSYASGAVTINTASGGGSGAAVQWTIKTSNNCLRTPIVLNCPLPVEFISVTAHKNQQGVLVSWSATEDHDRSDYIIERALGDGLGFVQIGTVAASFAQQYHFTDPLFENSGTAYYRIVKKQEEGDYAYSKIATVNFNESLISVQPNPFSHTTQLHAGADPALSFEVRLTDLSGKTREEFTVRGGDTVHIADELAPGTYLLHILHSDGTVEIQKLIKAQ